MEYGFRSVTMPNCFCSSLLLTRAPTAWLTRIFAPIFAFGAFVGIAHNKGQDSALDTSTVYTALSLFSLLADPLLSLVMALMAFAGSVGSFTRIQVFLEKESHIDPRDKVLAHPSNPLKVSKQLALVAQSEVAISESDSSQLSSKGSLSSLPHQMIAVQNGTFGWDSEKDPCVQNVTITIPSGTFAMLIGPSGCGKSTLLKAILGEVPCKTGAIQLATESVAFCDQSPWHMNASIRDCIVGMSIFDEAWYMSVINACALVKDFEQLPRGDETIIGSKGISLSGGQSQRIVSSGNHPHFFNCGSRFGIYRQLQEQYTPERSLSSSTMSSAVSMQKLKTIYSITW